MMDPLISVIVPIYNTAPYLDRCITSIINQTYSNLEIILVDDGSTDESPRICDEYMEEDCRIKVIHNVNGGPSSARNSGLDVCSGEYIGFVDSDDTIEPNMYEVMINACEQFDTLVAVCGRYVINGNEKIVDKCPEHFEKIDTIELVSRIFTGLNCDGGACDKIFHRSLWKKNRFPYGKIYEDIATTYKVILNTANAVMINVPLYNYYHRVNSITKSSFNEKLFDYPSNTRKIINDINNKYPEIFEYACWTHMKAIQYVLYRLFSFDNRITLDNMNRAKELSREISMYKDIWRKSRVFSKRDKLLCELFSKWYIAKPVYRLNMTIKKLRKI